MERTPTYADGLIGLTLLGLILFLLLFRVIEDDR